ncbi:LOW QUALITY PROTEIN: cadherin-like protein 26 [Rhinatrema bivittatum]|uniref:LOW QUALITY PROTEIN: cadherin-like protein 26 n=1 Tax=Rhinatrema bivittatum TaxID=194408 RepID=UPI0011279AB2|nr:LOW QUALITY PROTEIN: cadherin-like protein 26 [Rhinatrema bivittatum]
MGCPTGFLLLLFLVDLPCGQSGSLQPLRRSKRRWVLTTIMVQEEDAGPFPKFAGQLFNDRSANMSIRFLISGPGVDEFPEFGLFSVNETSGEVFVHRTIDREKTALFVVRFDVADRLTGKIVDRSLIFNVEVKDVNDNAPQFLNPETNINVKETNTLTNPVIQISATDRDKPDTPNSEVVYSLVSQSPSPSDVTFSIDPKNGLIRGKGCLNFETTKLFKLLIKARDNGTPQLSSTAVLNIAVEDGNNHMPTIISQTYVGQIHEGEIGSNVLRIRVEDKDTPQTPAWRAIYKILKGNENGMYNITTDPETNDGILSVIKPLNYEENPVRDITISVENEEPFSSCEKGRMVSDPVSVSSNVSVKVNVLDTNEPPKFHPGTYVVRQKEGLQPGTVLVTCNATDPDHASTQIRYKIIQDPAGWVTIDEKTGVITSVKELDRESPYVNNSVYSIIVYAVDDGDPPLTGTGTVLLYVTDTNDNTPYLLLPYMEMCEHLENPSLTVKAADKDLDPFAGPFIFELMQKSSTWELRKTTDDSAELSCLEKLPKGNYTVPLSIMDRQGASQKQILNVRVCSCPDGLTCEKLMPPSHSLGGGAIAALLGSLLLLLLCLCFLIHCVCGSASAKQNGFIPNDEGNQTLIKYNEEGGSSLCQTSPSLVPSSAQTRNEVTKINNQGSLGMSPSTLSAGTKLNGSASQGLVMPTFAAAGLTQNGTWTQAAAGMASSGRYLKENVPPQTTVYARNNTSRNRSLDIFMERVGELLNQRVHGFGTLEDSVVTDRIQIYAYEGEIGRADSFDTLSFADNDINMDFVAKLGSKFATLEEICRK